MEEYPENGEYIFSDPEHGTDKLYFFQNNGKIDGEYINIINSEKKIKCYFENGKQEGRNNMTFNKNKYNEFDSIHKCYYVNGKNYGFWIDVLSLEQENYIGGKLELKNGEQILKRFSHEISYYFFRDNKFDGECITYRTNEHYKRRVVLLNDKKEGKYVVDYDNLQTMVCFYIHGRTYGKYKSLYVDGRCQIECYYIAEKNEDKDKELDIYEQFTKSYSYINGKYDGIINKWNNKGDLISSCYYKDGKLKYLSVLINEYVQVKEHRNERYEIEKYSIELKNKNFCYDSDATCLICHLEHSDDMIQLNCRHNCHCNCLFKWFEQINQTKNYNCPYCGCEIDWKNVKKVV